MSEILELNDSTYVLNQLAIYSTLFEQCKGKKHSKEFMCSLFLYQCSGLSEINECRVKILRNYNRQSKAYVVALW